MSEHIHCEGSCGCSCSHNSPHENENARSPVLTAVIIVAGLCLLALSYISALPAPFALFLKAAAYFAVGHKVIFEFIKNLRLVNIFDENFLMIIASAGALIIGDAAEGIAVLTLFQIGEYFQERAVGSSRKSIAALMDIRPETARVLDNGCEKIVPVEQAAVGDIIKVLPGERIPLDGVVLNGAGALDTSALTGEPLPREIRAGDEVLSSSINLESVITIRVSSYYADSTAAKILELVEHCAQKKSRSENFIRRFARVYTPVVVAAALLLAVVGGFVSGDFHDFVYRSLAFLVVSCPCALVISVPLCYFASIGALARAGVLVKGGACLDKLRKTETVIFDKTGTLTTGSFLISEIKGFNGFDIKTVLEYTAHAEANSTHPIAVSVVREYGAIPDKSLVSNVRESAGGGISAVYKNKNVLVGSRRLMKDNGVSVPDSDNASIYVAIDNIFAGIISISDDIKPDAAKTVKTLKKLGISRVVMLTGDTESAAENVARRLGVDEYHAQLLPEDKASLTQQYNRVAFVGDGINDAPVIALSDVGFAMGGVGSQSAVEAADIVLMNDNPSSIVTALITAKRTAALVKQNIVFSLSVKLVIMLLSSFGVAGIMWAAVFADVGVALLAVLNAMRLLKIKA